MARAKVTAILINTQRSGQVLHFTSGPLQLLPDGAGLYFPITAERDVTASALFAQVESIMVSNCVAHNVTSIEPIRQVGNSLDIEIVYNEYEE